MNTIYFATMNEKKINSMRTALGDADVGIKGIAIDIPEIRSNDVEVIAKDKVLKAFEQIKKPCIAQDGGFFIKALNGFPGTYVQHMYKTIDVEGVLKLMEGIEDRSCEFRDTLAYMDESFSEPLLFTAKTTGTIATEIHPSAQEYDWGKLRRIFIPTGANVVASSMGEEEYEATKKQYQEDLPCMVQFADWVKTL